jgi:hypothetical protein
MKYVNTSSEARRWLHVQRPDGRGLELEPGEIVDLDQEVSDPFLTPVESKRKRAKVEPDPTPHDSPAEAEQQDPTDQPGDAPAEE